MKSRHHVAFRLLKKCDTIPDAQNILPQCRNAIMSILIENHLNDYNTSNFWKPTRTNSPQKQPYRSHSKSPDRRNSQNYKSTNDILSFNSLDGVSNNHQSPGIVSFSPIAPFSPIKRSYSPGDAIPMNSLLPKVVRANPSNTVNTNISNLKVMNKKSEGNPVILQLEESLNTLTTIIQPKLISLQKDLENIQTVEEYEKMKQSIISFDNIKKIGGSKKYSKNIMPLLIE